MVRIGVVGTNFISEWFVEAARRTEGRIEPAVVYSRSQERADAFARAHALPVGVSEFDTMLAQVDAVYVASPTAAHFSQAQAAIAAGRHVLVEKTMTASLAQAQTLFEAAEQHGVVAMEATRHLHLPAYAVLRDAVGGLGEIRHAHFEMQQYSSRYDRFRVGEHMNAFDPALGNSALADIGVYCLEPAVDLFGAPLGHSGSSVRLHNGFEASGVMHLDYGSMLVEVVYSKIAQGVLPSAIVGEAGAVTIDSLAEPSLITLQRRGGLPQTLWEAPKPAPAQTMHHELEVFAQQVEAGVTDARWRDVTVETRRLMDEHLAR